MAAIGLFAGAVAWPEPRLEPARPASFAIRGVAVVDVVAGVVRTEQTVVVADGRIAAVGPRETVAVPPGLRVVDGRARFVMPALWDMHTHVLAISPLLDMPLYVASGVTSVRDMQGCPSPGDPFIACGDEKRRWSREAVSGERVGPRIVETSSFMANGPGMAARLGDVPAYFDTATPAQARAFVRHFVGRADTIKVYDRIPRDAYLALADEARLRGMAVVGHRPHAVDAIEAARHQRSLEHARFLLHESFDGSQALRERAGSPSWREDRRAMVNRHDPARAREILSAMREAGTFYVPTHLTRWSDAFAHLPRVREDPVLRYVHPLLQRQWREDLDELLAEAPGPAARRGYLDFYRKGLDLTLEAQRAGVRIMVGTDYLAAGVDVHRELEQLVHAGLTPAEALRAATVTPAAYAGEASERGQVLRGMVADLVLLDADPLRDIRNTRRIRGVVFAGALYDEVAVRAIDSHVARNARSWTVGAKIIWRFIRNPGAY
ncbi:amidohydrolase family protein [Luteimonas vadosa]|uniref:Amidohydrolase family protein n=1 Tax=Luteimonas vadosa TaxID=1165507 RepID=A0ABP9E2B5_9GAMM